MPNHKQSNAWQKLEEHYPLNANFSLLEAFSKDPSRAHKLSFESSGIFADFSKALMTDETLSLLLNLIRESDLASSVDAMKQGDAINHTENRQVLHYLLRARPEDIPAHLKKEYAEVCHSRQKMQQISDEILTNKRLSATGKPFTDIVHIGIGGSYLGPAMIYEALSPFQQSTIRCHFVSNICANEISDLLATLKAETTLFIVASKTFTTLETLCNADTAKNWLINQLGQSAISQHIYAVTSNTDKAIAYGIKKDNILGFWDWVGGRYSAFSPIGLVLSIGLGYDNFLRILEGAREMDQHFFNQPYESNLPVILAATGIWYINFHQKDTHCIASYDYRLRSFRAFLQQLEMESNGKSISKEGQPLDYTTCPTIFGEPGTNCQHSYFQLLHQSTDFIPVDFIACIKPGHSHKNHHDWLLANCFAQSQALMLGSNSEKNTISKHKLMPGNRPSTTLLLDELSPERIGALIALYEHKVFVQGVVWHINSFDQWGVELGKTISRNIHEAMDNPSTLQDMDTSSQQLIERCLK